MRIVLFVVAVVNAAVAAAALPAYGGIVLPPYLAWLPPLLPAKMLVYPAITFWVAGALALVVIGFTFIGVAGVALSLAVIALVSLLVSQEVLTLAGDLAFMASHVAAVFWFALAALAATMFVRS